MNDEIRDKSGVVPDLPTAQALVRLRLLADEAARRAADTSPAGQHQALIALDGACEFALWLAAHHLDLDVKRGTRFADLYAQIVDARPWKFTSWVTVKQMHEARNSAQHAAVISDSIQMPGWRDVSLAFIDALCVEVFDIQLSDIQLANAIRDDSLREMLRNSEEQLAESPAASMELVFRAFEVALYGWRKQLGHPVVPLFAQGQQMPAPTSTLMVGIDEVQPFATNPGEYVWLRRAWQEMETAAWVPRVEDIRRALSFVTTWIVRWELFTLGYPDAEWAAHRDGIEPPKSAARPGIHVKWAHTAMQPETPGQPPRNVVHFQLANVPGRGRTPWDVILSEAFMHAVRDLDAPQLRPVSWSPYGILTVHADLDADPSIAADVVEAALTRAVERFDAAMAESETREQVRQTLELELGQLVREHADNTIGLIDSVRVVPDQWLGTAEWMALIGVQSTSPDLLELNALLHAFRNQRSANQEPVFRDVNTRIANEIRFIISDLTDEMKGAAITAIKNAQEHVGRVREIRANQQEAAREFAARIGERFASWPQSRPEQQLTDSPSGQE